MSSSDQCAVGPGGKLLPAERIQWYDDPDDKEPIVQPSNPTPPAPLGIVLIYILEPLLTYFR